MRAELTRQPTDIANHGPTPHGTPCYVVQQYSQEVVPPPSDWSGCALTAAMLTNSPVLDFGGGAAGGGRIRGACAVTPTARMATAVPSHVIHDSAVAFRAPRHAAGRRAYPRRIV